MVVGVARKKCKIQVREWQIGSNSSTSMLAAAPGWIVEKKELEKRGKGKKRHLNKKSVKMP